MKSVKIIEKNNTRKQRTRLHRVLRYEVWSYFVLPPAAIKKIQTAYWRCILAHESFFGYFYWFSPMWEHHGTILPRDCRFSTVGEGVGMLVVEGVEVVRGGDPTGRSQHPPMGVGGGRGDGSDIKGRRNLRRDKYITVILRYE